MQPRVWEHYALIFSVVCHVVLLWRLWSEKIVGVYLFLTLFLAAETIQDAILLAVRPRSAMYATLYVFSTPVVWILAYFVVLELYNLILADYPGISSVGRKAVTYCMAAAVVISFLYGIWDPGTDAIQFRILHFYSIFERSIVLGLLLFLVLIQLFLVRYRLRLSPNRMIYATGYALYFGIGVAQDMLFTVLGIRVVYLFNLWTVAVAGVLLLAGAWLLTSKGEVKVALDFRDTTAERIRLQQQLTDINQLLARAARGRG